VEFAPPQPGGKGAYKTLFQSMRALYMKIGADQAPADAQKKGLPAGEKADNT
jgi:hypothetical protein